MPPPAPNTYAFDNSTSASASNVTSSDLQFVDDGVTFSWSMTSVGGSNYTAHWGAGVGILNAGNMDGADEVWTLQALGGTGTAVQTQMTGNATNPLNIEFSFVTGQWVVSLVNSASTLTGTVSGTSLTFVTGLTYSAQGQFSEIRFTPLTENGIIYIRSLTATINCFLEGTYIATPHGEAAVETLSSGDVITTADGGTTTVKWVGQQDIATRFAMPEKANPICIKAGALGAGVPSRDLYVTGDHALHIDGLLINASCLTNGRSIYQVSRMPLDGFSYYHVETDAHELLVAEGVAAETFIDYVGRDAFHNADEHHAMYPDQVPIAEMDLPRISAKRLVPVATRKQLGERAKLNFPARQATREIAA